MCKLILSRRIPQSPYFKKKWTVRFNPCESSSNFTEISDVIQVHYTEISDRGGPGLYFAVVKF